MVKPRLHFAWVVLGLEFQISRADLGAISFVSFVLYGFSQPLVGKLVDQYGPRRVLSCSILLTGLGLALTSYVQSMWELLLFLALFNFIGSLAAGYFSDRWDKGKMLAVTYAIRILTLLFLLTVNDPVSLGLS